MPGGITGKAGGAHLARRATIGPRRLALSSAAGGSKARPPPQLGGKVRQARPRPAALPVRLDQQCLLAAAERRLLTQLDEIVPVPCT